jgi:hypothetical protein
LTCRLTPQTAVHSHSNTPPPLQLAFFEPDAKRAAAMHQRRIDAVAPLLGELSPSVYTHLHAVLSREAAGAADALFAARYRLLEAAVAAAAAAGAGEGSPPGQEALRRLSELRTAGGAAVRFYDHFSRCWADKRLPQPVPPLAAAAGDGTTPSLQSLQPLPGAMPLEPDQVLPYLQAQLAATMLLRRLASLPAAGDGSAHTSTALARARWLVRCGQALPSFGLEPADVARWRQMEPIVRELAELLAAAGAGGAR